MVVSTVDPGAQELQQF
uniref:SFRICE_039007 n=1 Tax=Spodoptera frugiperda TaxID=7108 RepID=A0A2H1WPF9_SPOFR